MRSRNSLVAFSDCVITTHLLCLSVSSVSGHCICGCRGSNRSIDRTTASWIHTGTPAAGGGSASFCLTHTLMCPTMALPQDILEEILSHLRFDFPSLKACSLTHPSLLLPSNRLLFAKIRVWDSRGPPTDICLELRKVLVASKHMAASIRSLILNFVWSPKESGTGIFPSLLQLLPNLQRLSVHLARGNISIFNADSFPSPHSISSVRTLILKKIRFDTTSQLYSLLASFNHLEDITMNAVRIDDTNATTHLVPNRQSCFPSTLELNLDGPVIEALLSPQSTVSMANLRVLTVYTNSDQDVEATSSILPSASSSLQVLTLLLPITESRKLRLLLAHY